ncbi:MAG: hypothetical protein IAI48_06525, partial [Candidatus Eremiobacteraeota bacterium]|nr:hypothetical protein [Candidatus Eremiobacteraeota bacterium]
ASFLQRESRTRLRDRVTVRGFALDVVTGLPADRVAIVSDGRVVAHARPSRWNPEPAQEWHDDELARAAFVATIPASAFGVGRHDVTIVASRAGGTARPLEHHVTLVVTRRVRPVRP